MRIGMMKTMTNSYLDDWLIYQATSESARKVASKRDFEYILEHELNGSAFKVFPIEYATAREMAEIASQEFENANYHELVSFPEKLLKALDNEGIPEESCKNVVRELCGDLLRFL